MAYPNYPLPPNESHRLRELERYGIDEALGEGAENSNLKRILDLATDVLAMPIGLISLVEQEQQRFVCRTGLEVSGTSREMAFCSHAIAANEIVVVPDALDDERFSNNPLVIDQPGIRFYAGAPLQTPRGYPLGTLCVLDKRPRQFSAQQTRWLESLSAIAMGEIEWRHRSKLCPVTGLQLRRLLFQVGNIEIGRARRFGNSLSLLNFDIDNFIQINHRWGHAAGDQVLIDITALCKKYLQEDDLMARLYDESFAILLVGNDSEQALAIAEELRQAIGHLLGVFTGSDYHLRLSGGVTSLSSSDRDFADLFARAEQALFVAKGNGRDQIACLMVN